MPKEEQKIDDVSPEGDSSNEEVRKLYLSTTDAKIAGVCGGIAEYLEIDSLIVRLTFIFVAIITAVIPMIIFYILAWAIIPRKME